MKDSLNLIDTPDSLNQVQAKAIEVIETVRNTPADVLLSGLLESLISFGLKLIAAFVIYAVGAWAIRKIKGLLKRIMEKKSEDIQSNQI